MTLAALASLALALAALPVDPQKDARKDGPADSPVAAKPFVYEFPEQQLVVDLSELKFVRERQVPEGNPQHRRTWSAKLDKQSLRIELHVFSRRRLGLDLPEDVLGLLEDHYSKIYEDDGRTRTGDSRWELDERTNLPGTFGFVPYAMLGWKLENGETPHHYAALAGVGETEAWLLEITTSKPLDDEHRAMLRDYLAAHVRYTGDPWVREWKDEELVERWKREGPDELADDLEHFRTDHFVILTNSSGKKSFAKKLEEAYDRIREVYPFEERADLRLLPIYLFRTPQQYYAFCEKTLKWSRSQAAASKGVAWKDFYATWYDAPADPVHIHEVTHQLFRNRLFLTGAGSWFQEGVAEYISTSENERGEFRRLVKDERTVPLADFLLTRSLLGSNPDERIDGTDPAHEAYLQAACIIEFVRESKQHKKKFQDFVHVVGSAPRGDLKGIEAALRASLGVSLEQFQEQFLAYWKKRR